MKRISSSALAAALCFGAVLCIPSLALGDASTPLPSEDSERYHFRVRPSVEDLISAVEAFGAHNFVDVTFADHEETTGVVLQSGSKHERTLFLRDFLSQDDQNALLDSQVTLTVQGKGEQLSDVPSQLVKIDEAAGTRAEDFRRSLEAEASKSSMSGGRGSEEGKRQGLRAEPSALGAVADPEWEKMDCSKSACLGPPYAPSRGRLMYRYHQNSHGLFTCMYSREWMVRPTTALSFRVHCRESPTGVGSPSMHMSTISRNCAAKLLGREMGSWTLQ